MTYTALFWLLSLVTAALRLLVIGRIGLSGDEAHYWVYGQNLSLSYFDHPPLIGYIIRAFTQVLGNTEFAVRLPTVLIFIATSYVAWRLARELFGEKTAFWTAVLLNVTPVFSFLGAVMTVPDAPLALCWITFAWMFSRFVKDGDGRWWYALGAVAGIGMLSKYNAVLLFPSTALFLLASPRHRQWFFRKEPWLGLGIAFILFSPVLVWNLQNYWVSFGFQLQHGFGKAAPKFSLSLLGRCLSAQAGYISPILFVVNWAVLAGLARSWFKEKDEPSLFIFAFAAPTLLLFNAIACFNEILPHWPATGYLVLSIAVAHHAVRTWDRRGARALTVAGWSLALFLTVLVPLQALYKVVRPEWFLPKAEAVRLEDGITRAEKVDVTNELYGWHEAGKHVAEMAASEPGSKPFIFTHRHYVASQLWFAIPGNPEVFCLSDRLDAYDLWQRDPDVLAGRDGIFVTNDYFYIDPSKVFPFKSWDKPQVVEIFRGGRKVRLFWLWRGRGFDPSRLAPEYRSPVPKQRCVDDAAVRLDHRLFWIVNHGMHIKTVDRLMWLVTMVDTDYAINSMMLVLVGVVAIVIWNVRRNRFWQELGLIVGIIAVGGILVHFLKDWIGRDRPLGVFGNQVWCFNERLERGSFPSGHTQIAFSVATYLSSLVKKHAWFFYLCAFLMGLSRVYVGSHFPLDVLGGAIIGVVVAAVMIKLIPIE